MLKIGIDLGGTNIAVGIVNQKGKILFKKTKPTHSEKGRKYILKTKVKWKYPEKYKSWNNLSPTGMHCKRV